MLVPSAAFPSFVSTRSSAAAYASTLKSSSSLSFVPYCRMMSEGWRSASCSAQCLSLMLSHSRIRAPFAPSASYATPGTSRSSATPNIRTSPSPTCGRTVDRPRPARTPSAARDTFFGPRVESVSADDPARADTRPPRRLLQVVDVESRDALAVVALGFRGKPRRRLAARVERHAADTVRAVAGERAGDAVDRPARGRAVRDVVVEVPLPWVRQEDEPVPGVAEPRLLEPAHRPGHEVGRDDRVAVVQDTRDRAALLLDGSGERRIEAVERVPGRVLDGERTEALRELLLVHGRRLLRHRGICARSLAVDRRRPPGVPGRAVDRDRAGSVRPLPVALTAGLAGERVGHRLLVGGRPQSELADGERGLGGLRARRGDHLRRVIPRRPGDPEAAQARRRVRDGEHHEHDDKCAGRLGVQRVRAQDGGRVGQGRENRHLCPVRAKVRALDAVQQRPLRRLSPRQLHRLLAPARSPPRAGALPRRRQLLLLLLRHLGRRHRGARPLRSRGLERPLPGRHLRRQHARLLDRPRARPHPEPAQAQGAAPSLHHLLPGRPCHLQVLQLRGRFRPVRAPFARRLPRIRAHVPPRRCPAVRHLVLHVRDHELHDRRLPSSRSSRPRSYLDYLLFVAFFPHLVAGPIVRPRQMLPQLAAPPSVDSDTQARGLWLIATGLCKKIAIGDTLCGQHRRPRLRQPRALLGGRAGRRRLRLRHPDLLRLLRLHRHRHRQRASLRLPPARELQRALPGAEPPGLLAPLAHLALALGSATTSTSRSAAREKGRCAPT